MAIDEIVGRQELSYPYLGKPGGATLNNQNRLMFETLSDNANSRFTKVDGLANGITTEFKHNLGSVLDDLIVNIYTISESGGGSGGILQASVISPGVYVGPDGDYTATQGSSSGQGTSASFLVTVVGGNVTSIKSIVVPGEEYAVNDQIVLDIAGLPETFPALIRVDATEGPVTADRLILSNVSGAVTGDYNGMYYDAGVFGQADNSDQFNTSDPSYRVYFKSDGASGWHVILNETAGGAWRVRGTSTDPRTFTNLDPINSGGTTAFANTSETDSSSLNRPDSTDADVSYSPVPGAATESYTLVPYSSGYTIQGKSGQLATTIQVTNNTGSSKDIAIVVSQDAMFAEQLRDFDSSSSPEDGQTWVWSESSSKYVLGASGDASFKLQSIVGSTLLVKSGYIILNDGRELTSENAGDLSVDLSAVVSDDTYYFYIDLNAVSATVTINGREMASVESDDIVALTESFYDVDMVRYIPLGGATLVGGGSTWTTLWTSAYRRHDLDDSGLVIKRVTDADSPVAVQWNTHYHTDTENGEIVFNFPDIAELSEPQKQKSVVKISDKGIDPADILPGTWQNNKCVMSPFSGQFVDNLAADEAYNLDVKNGWVLVEVGPESKGAPLLLTGMSITNYNQTYQLLTKNFSLTGSNVIDDPTYNVYVYDDTAGSTSGYLVVIRNNTNSTWSAYESATNPALWQANDFVSLTNVEIVALGSEVDGGQNRPDSVDVNVDYGPSSYVLRTTDFIQPTTEGGSSADTGIGELNFVQNGYFNGNDGVSGWSSTGDFSALSLDEGTPLEGDASATWTNDYSTTRGKVEGALNTVDLAYRGVSAMTSAILRVVGSGGTYLTYLTKDGVKVDATESTIVANGGGTFYPAALGTFAFDGSAYKYVVEDVSGANGDVLTLDVVKASTNGAGVSTLVGPWNNDELSVGNLNSPVYSQNKWRINGESIDVQIELTASSGGVNSRIFIEPPAGYTPKNSSDGHIVFGGSFHDDNGVHSFVTLKWVAASSRWEGYRQAVSGSDVNSDSLVGAGVSGARHLNLDFSFEAVELENNQTKILSKGTALENGSIRVSRQLSNQSLQQSANTDLIWNTIDYQVGTDISFSSGSSTFTINRKGRYRIIASAEIAGGATSDGQVELDIRDTSNNIYARFVNRFPGQCIVEEEFTAGQQLKALIFTSLSGRSLASGSLSNLVISRLPDETGQGLVGAGIAGEGKLGLVEANLFKKRLSEVTYNSNASNILELTSVPQGRYRITLGVGYSFKASTTSNAYAQLILNGSQIAAIGSSPSGSTAATYMLGVSNSNIVEFPNPTNTVSMSVVANNSGLVQNPYYILEKLENVVEIANDWN